MSLCYRLRRKELHIRSLCLTRYYTNAPIHLENLSGRSGLTGKRVPELVRNPDPCFTPGSTPGFGPGSGSNSVAVSSNRNTEPLDFTLLAS